MEPETKGHGDDMNNHLSKAFVAAAALALAGQTNAADLPAAAPAYKAPAPVAAAHNWTGFYVGGNVGYGWGNGDTDFNPLPSAAGFVNLAPTKLSPHPKGVLGGAQIGYNWQTGPWVWGIEADIQGADINGSAIQSPIIQLNGTSFGAGSTLTASEKIDWLGTARGRVGFAAAPQVLLYATGGLVYGDAKYAANSNFLPVGNQQYPASISDTRFGWTAGGGIEWAFAGPWSAKFEGLYYDLGRVSTIANGVPGLPAGTCGGTGFCQVGYSWKTTGAIVRFGVDYKFGG
jgi:outer membrane immunogenic protein